MLALITLAECAFPLASHQTAPLSTVRPARSPAQCISMASWNDGYSPATGRRRGFVFGPESQTRVERQMRRGRQAWDPRSRGPRPIPPDPADAQEAMMAQQEQQQRVSRGRRQAGANDVRPAAVQDGFNFGPDSRQPERRPRRAVERMRFAEAQKPRLKKEAAEAEWLANHREQPRPGRHGADGNDLNDARAAATRADGREGFTFASESQTKLDRRSEPPKAAEKDTVKAAFQAMQDAEAAWLAQQDTPSWGPSENAAPIEETTIIGATNYAAMQDAKQAWLAGQDTPSWGPSKGAEPEPEATGDFYSPRRPERGIADGPRAPAAASDVGAAASPWVASPPSSASAASVPNGPGMTRPPETPPPDGTPRLEVDEMGMDGPGAGLYEPDMDEPGVGLYSSLGAPPGDAASPRGPRPTEGVRDDLDLAGSLSQVKGLEALIGNAPAEVKEAALDWCCFNQVVDVNVLLEDPDEIGVVLDHFLAALPLNPGGVYEMRLRKRLDAMIAEAKPRYP